jgi:hypothetical protein
MLLNPQIERPCVSHSSREAESGRCVSPAALGDLRFALLIKLRETVIVPARNHAFRYNV